MPDKVFHIKSSTGKYDFVQDARCMHCLFFIRKRHPSQRYDTMYCSFHLRFVGSNFMACNDFEPNSKYVVVNQYVQLNLFDHA